MKFLSIKKTLFFLDFFIIIFDIVGMKRSGIKRIILLYIIIGTVLFGCGEAETILSEDEIRLYNNEPKGQIESITATVNKMLAPDGNGYIDLQTSINNPFIRISFSTPAYSASIKYDETVIVEYNGIVLSHKDGDYIAVPDDPSDPNEEVSFNSILIIIPMNPLPTTDTEAKIILTSGIKSYSDNSIELSGTKLFPVTVYVTP
ncbi:MAG: hypothetical protein FWH53_05720 [Leptospirales bacterium]|nr:hypothetical protein [Leptospirales bacterium]MCL2155144.1 hypothetical protein [Leptospirales bacterium]